MKYLKSYSSLVSSLKCRRQLTLLGNLVLDSKDLKLNAYWQQNEEGSSTVLWPKLDHLKIKPFLFIMDLEIWG